ncbi:MAG: hypothetical protein HQL97_10910 [Magnetococcales bacterium]|nr:hypothetical protein [Magnetococcales bacterium]
MFTTRKHDWFCGAGTYFWTSDTRLVDVELGYCATRQDLERAISVVVKHEWEGQPVGGIAYRTREEDRQHHASTFLFFPAGRQPILAEQPG